MKIRTQPFHSIDREAVIDVLSDGLREVMNDCDKYTEHVQLLGLDRQAESNVLSNLLLISARANEHLQLASNIIRDHVLGRS